MQFESFIIGYVTDRLHADSEGQARIAENLPSSSYPLAETRPILLPLPDLAAVLPPGSIRKGTERVGA